MIVRRGTVAVQEFRATYPGGLGGEPGLLRSRGLGDAAGLAAFGIYEEVLEPGARGSLPHWHEREDEFVYVLEGRLTVVEDGQETTLGPGDAAGWAAGAPVAHAIRNDGAEPATFLIVGGRFPDEVVHYPGTDLVFTRRAGVGTYTHLDGTPYDTER